MSEDLISAKLWPQTAAAATKKVDIADPEK